MPKMRKDNRRTSSATRQARIKGNAGGSQPRPRPTQVSTIKQQGPLRPKTVTENNRSTSPRLPKLPKKPVQGTTYTIRALGGNSRDAKINRLSAQARPTSGVRSAPQMRSEAAAKAARNAALRRGAGRAGAVAAGAALFNQGRSGSALDKAVQKLPGIKANPKTDLGARASRAIMNAFKKKKKR